MGFIEVCLCLTYCPTTFQFFFQYLKKADVISKFNPPNCWVFGLRPSSGILKTKYHNVSENGTVSVFRWVVRHLLFWVLQKELTSITGSSWRFALSKGPNGVSPPHVRTETDPVSETLCFIGFRILDDGQSPKTQQFWVLYTTVRTLYNPIVGLMYLPYRPSATVSTTHGVTT
jgi:hypothetical protein